MSTSAPLTPVSRTDLADAPAAEGTLLATVCHLSDLHVMDAASPMRFEWIETLADDPRWHPLLHMHRPQESLVPWAVAAHIDALRADPTGSTRGAQLDLVVFTGDNIDNAQRNELDAYLSLVAGGTCRLSPVGSAMDASGLETDGVWPFWSPRTDVVDSWKPSGYPVVHDLMERAAQPLVSPGLGLRWASLPGNHDLLCQGTAFVNDALNAAAIGSTKALWPPALLPDDPLSLFVESPETFLGAGTRQIAADPDRRGITLREWIQLHVNAGAAGLSQANVARVSPDTTVDLGEVTMMILDTNHPAGDYQGSIGRTQLQWLDMQLDDADADGRLVVLASHHGVDTLVNTRGDDPERLLAQPMLDMVHRHPCVVAWLVGHRHIHRVTPRPGAGGGFWEITTASIIDWPVERRSIEIIRHTDGTVELACSVHGHDAADGSLAAIHRQLAQRFGGSQRGGAMAGTDHDRNVRLFVPRRPNALR